MTKATRKKQDRATRVLIVDDHPVVRKGLTAMINQEEDLRVCAETEDFHQALAAIKEHVPDLAVVDLTLSGIGGLALVKHLESSNPDLPVLVLSMHDETLYAERVLRAGAKGYIMKQEGTDKLVTAIRRILHGEIYVSEKMSSKMLGQLVGRGPRTSGSHLETLSDRELEVFELIGRGQGTRQIAERLCLSFKTVESHREHIKEKLELSNANELVQHATQWVVTENAD